MNRRILIVDDDVACLQLYRTALQPCLTCASCVTDPRYDVTTVRTVDEGLRRVRSALGEGTPFAAAFVGGGENAGNFQQLAMNLRRADPQLYLVLATDLPAHDMVHGEHVEDRVYYLRKPLINAEVAQLARNLVRNWERDMGLQGADNRLRQIMDSLPCGVFVVTPDGHPTYANSEACRLLGLKIVPGTTGQRVSERFPVYRAGTNESYPVEDAPLSRALQGYRTVADDIEIDRHGERVLVETSAAPVFGSGGEIGCAVAAVKDVTERRQIESELRQAQKLQAIGQLAAGVAHEFNNLLMGVRGLADIASSTLDSQSATRSYLGEIQNAALSGATITRQLLTFSRRQVPGPRSTFSLNDSVAASSSMLHGLLGDAIALRIHPGARFARIRANPRQIQLVLVNLATNARDAMPDGGELTIETADVPVDGAQAKHCGLRIGAYVALRVSDTGTGMSPEIQQQIFDPFFTTKDMGLGTGLGLSTVYGVVQAAGGHIRVKSRPGHGSTFELLLPCAPVATRQPANTRN